MGKIKVGYGDGSGAGINDYEDGEGLCLTTDDEKQEAVVMGGDMDGCPAGVKNREWADKLVVRYNAFEPGGAVERLVRNTYFTPGGAFSAIRTNHELVRRAVAELEALLPKRESEAKDE